MIVSCPDDIDLEKPYTFIASVSGSNPNAKLKYNWTISTGIIVEGQGTASIKVNMPGLQGINTTATVEVEGLGAGCPNKASCTTTINCILSRIFDQYGNISFNDEKARLDNFAIQLQNEPVARGYIIAYGGRITFASQALERAVRAKEYLISKHSIPDSRIVTIDGGYREDLTVELWVLPPDVTPPTASPTLRPEDVEIIEKPTPARPRRRRSP